MLRTRAEPEVKGGECVLEATAFLISLVCDESALWILLDEWCMPAERWQKSANTQEFLWNSLGMPCMTFLFDWMDRNTTLAYSGELVSSFPLAKCFWPCRSTTAREKKKKKHNYTPLIILSLSWMKKKKIAAYLQQLPEIICYIHLIINSVLPFRRRCGRLQDLTSVCHPVCFSRRKLPRCVVKTCLSVISAWKHCFLWQHHTKVSEGSN